MILIYMIIAAPAMTATAQGTLECNLTARGAQRCFGVLGEPLIFYLPTDPQTKTRLEKNTDSILTFKNYSFFNINEKYKNHMEISRNGTFTLKRATKADSGAYKLDAYNTEGIALYTVTIHLHIQAPVSEPAVSQMCLSPSQMTVSCSSEGDDVEFILSLDNNLIQNKAESAENESISNVTISLHGGLMGNLTCIAQNNVSRKQTITHLTSCTAPVSEPAVSQMCLSPEQMTVSCSSEGDDVEFILSLDDNLLIQTTAKSSEKQRVSNVTIQLHGQLMGKLACVAQNNVSRAQTAIHLTGCTGSSSHLCVVAIAVVGSITTLFILAVLLGIRHFNKSTGVMTVHGNDAEDAEDDVVYSDIRLKQHTRKTPPSSNQDDAS